MDPMFMKEYSRITQDLYVYEYIKKINMYLIFVLQSVVFTTSVNKKNYYSKKKLKIITFNLPILYSANTQ